MFVAKPRLETAKFLHFGAKMLSSQPCIKYKRYFYWSKNVTSNILNIF